MFNTNSRSCRIRKERYTMKMSEYKEIPEGRVGDVFVKKTIENVHINPLTNEKEGHAVITIQPFRDKRTPSSFEKAFAQAGLNIFEVKNNIHKQEMACV